MRELEKVISTQQSAKSTRVLSYKDLIAWQKADLLARSVLSVPTNIVEGFGRLNKNEFRHFFSIALGSLSEVSYLIEFAYGQRYIASEQFKTLSALREECGRLVWNLHKSQKTI